EAGAGRLSGLDAVMFVILEAADAGDDEDGRGDNVGAVSLPQLEELLAPQLLVDLPGQAVSLVHHARPASPPAQPDLRAASKIAPRPPGEKCATVREPLKSHKSTLG